jgi:pyrimidine-nucleoside phosphorylase
MLSIHSILEAKRDGQALSDEQIRYFIGGVLDGSITRAQAAAWLAMVYLRGMGREETVSLTRAMTRSGDLLSWPGLEGPFVDKHSTGGVGDKVSLVLAPLWAELGARVPMISGRGLGHTGGTLDKLEAIAGYRTDLELPELRRALEEVGCFINGQTGELAPADRYLYALRNETATVPSIPLITASILSKKLAEGIDELVMDVKYGAGAFMKTEADARALADSLKEVGEGAGVHTRVCLTDMNEPLGEAVGNALEVEEAQRCLRGEGPADLEQLVCRLIGDDRALPLLRSGGALGRWERMVRAHGGDSSAPLLRCDAYAIAQAAFLLGAGRERADQAIHPGVGLRIWKKGGQRVEAGEALGTLVHAGRGLDEARQLCARAWTWADAD